LIKREGINKYVEFHLSGRANLINDEVCSLLKQMNVRSISLGLESGSPEILNFLKGSSVTVKHNFTAVETIKNMDYLKLLNLGRGFDSAFKLILLSFLHSGHIK
ncbi:hypothetical protein LCGC14_2470930, partial [marine sediment metagenome]